MRFKKRCFPVHLRLDHANCIDRADVPSFYGYSRTLGAARCHECPGRRARGRAAGRSEMHRINKCIERMKLNFEGRRPADPDFIRSDSYCSHDSCACARENRVIANEAMTRRRVRVQGRGRRAPPPAAARPRLSAHPPLAHHPDEMMTQIVCGLRQYACGRAYDPQ